MRPSPGHPFAHAAHGRAHAGCHGSDVPVHQIHVGSHGGHRGHFPVHLFHIGFYVGHRCKGFVHRL